MFTQDSRKFRLALAAVLALGGLYAIIVATLMTLSTWAERDLHAFPFKDEDWLRYLLPSRVPPDGRSRIMLTGPSTVRENLLYERFEAAFPGHAVLQGGISLGTLEDVTASLDYVRMTHGVDALPDLLVLGIAPRFIANIPDERPFKVGIDRYSPHLSTRQRDDGVEFVPKGPWEGIRARAQFLASKEPERFRTALVAVAYRWLAGRDAVGAWAADTQGVERSWLDRVLLSPPVPQIVRAAGLARVLHHSLRDLLAWRASPYKYTFDPPIEYGPPRHDAGMHDGWWKDVYAWNPARDRQSALAHLQKFKRLAAACGIEVWVVNMPEREVSRAQFDDANYEAYLHLVREAFGGDRLLDLRELLRTDEFYDREHTVPAGSRRLTDPVIGALKSGLPATPGPGSARSRACAEFDRGR